jgi:4-hydroxy-3-methylbut-2-en-1-yl diphosphate synthase IspG/GcpE
VVVPPIFSCGPGEAADADFGYVGGAWGKVSLYVGKTAVKFNIPEAEARSGLPNAHRDDGKRFVVHADEKLTAFVELESAIRAK